MIMHSTYVEGVHAPAVSITIRTQEASNIVAKNSGNEMTTANRHQITMSHINRTGECRERRL